MNKHFTKNIFVKATYRLVENSGIEFAGWLAYLNLFSIFPFIFILVVAISFFSEATTGESLTTNILTYLPLYLVEVLKPQIDTFIAGPPIKLLSFVFISSVWTASSSVSSLKQIFNKIYDVKNPPNFLVTRIKSILQFLSAIIIIISSMIFFIVIPTIFFYLEKKINIELPDLGHPMLRYVAITVIMISIISLIYYSLTNRKLHFQTTIPGAVFAFIIWYISVEGLAFYTHNFFNELNVTYGSLATLIVVLIFFYIINFALLYGAELNYQILKTRIFKEKN